MPNQHQSPPNKARMRRLSTAVGAILFLVLVSTLAAFAPDTVVAQGPGTGIIEVRVAASSDDAEESSTGKMDLSSSDLEMVYDGSDQTVGMRFNGIEIPPGATIAYAYVQFQVDETPSALTSLEINGQDADNAPTFTSSDFDISSRPRTAATVAWDPPLWPTVGEAGADQQTPDISAVIQEIVSRPGWSSGNSLVIIVTGTGERTAEAFNGEPTGAPLLHVEFASGSVPLVTISAPVNGATVGVGDAVNFAGTAVDEEDGDVTAALEWESSINGPIGTGGSFSRSDLSAGVHTITAAATDLDGLTGFDTVEISILNSPPTVPAVVSPADGATGVSSSTSLEVTVSDPEGSDLTVTFYGRPAAPVFGDDFTLIALPDTQHYVDDPANYANFGAQTQWIVDNREALNIPFVTHLGDIVENGNNYGDDTEWLVADGAMSLLEDPATTLLADGVPYGLAIGNHDVYRVVTTRTASFNKFFGVSRFEDRAYYGGHYGTNNDNSYELFSASGLDFITVHFDNQDVPDPAVLAWADNLLKTYSDRRAIAVAHELLGTGNPGTFSSQGQAIYDELKDNPNLFLMLGGHFGGEGRREDTYNGNTVYSLLSNYQGLPNGGNGWLRRMEFSPANSEIRVKTYSPVLDQFDTGDSSQFTLFYDMGYVNFQVLGTNTNVPSGSNTNLNWAGLENNLEYEWYVTVDDGDSVITGPAWSFTTGGGVNTPPLATDDTSTVDEGGTWVEPAPGVLSNDMDPDNDTLAVTTTPVTTPANGTVTLGADGSYSYTHGGSETTSDSFVYEVCDAGGLCDTATVNLTITPVNDPPQAVGDTGTVAEGGTLDEPAPGMLDNDNDPENDPLTVTTTPVTTPANGTVTLGGDGSYNYAHDGSETTSDSFVYEVCDDLGACDTATVTLTITAVNDPPLALDDTAITQEDTPVTIDVAANDTDPDGSLVLASTNTTCAGCAEPSNGSLVNNADGTFVYTPGTDYTGGDSFVYEICDSGAPVKCDTAMVSITVTVANDPPLATDDNATTDEDTSVTINVAANDSDPDGNLDPASANSTCDNGSAGCAGAGKGSLTDNGDGTITYTPDPDSNGSDSFVYEICDLVGSCTTATVNVTVTPVNDLPVAADDAATTAEDSAVNIAVLGNDDFGGDGPSASTITVLTLPGNGTAGVHDGSTPADPTDDTIDYAPNANYHGGDSFTYQICDVDGDCDPATVSVTVTPVEDVPLAVADTATVAEDSAVNIAVLDNDDFGGDGPSEGSITVLSAPANGTAVVNQGGMANDPTDDTIDYTPNTNYHGPDSLIYQICDANADCATATVDITVDPVNDLPLAADDIATVAEDSPVNIAVLGNDDFGGDGPSTGSITILTSASHGAATVNDGSTPTDPSDDTIDYTPNANYNGADGFTYQICDANADCATASVNITVTPVNDLPLAADDTATVIENSAVNIAVLGNDDFGGDGPSAGPITVLSAASNGTATVNEFGTPTDPTDDTIDYTPNAGYLGVDSFTYQICDADGDCDTATVDITVNEPLPDVFEGRVSASSDDAEELATGRVALNSGDLQLVFDKDRQTVGLRFNGVAIPQGATIVSASVQFQVDEISVEAAALEFYGEAHDNAPTFVNSSGNVSGRTPTSATMSWDSVPPWDTVGAAGDNQRTPNIAPIIQEIVDRQPVGGQTGWVSGNSLVIIITGTGTRVADSYNGDQAGAPLLHVEYYGGSSNNPPLAADDMGTVAEGATLDEAAPGVLDNDGDPENDPLTVSTTPVTPPTNGTVILYADGSYSYVHDGSETGSDSFVYEVCDAGSLCDTATVNLTVTPVNDPPLATDDVGAVTQGGTLDELAPGVLSNDNDPENDPLTVSTTPVTPPANGTLTLYADGSYTYVHDGSETGSDSFVYEICDTGTPVLCTTAMVNLTITTATTNLSFAPIYDAMVSSKKPTDNYGAATTLEIRSQSQETIVSYLKFDISGVTGTILSAKLRLYADKATSDGGSIYLVSNDYLPAELGEWVEGGLTWENAPSLDGEALSTVGAVVGDTWVEFDVPAELLGEGTHSFGLSTPSSNRAVYRSKEAVDNHPVLILEIGSNP